MGALNSVCSKPLTALVIVVVGVVHAERYLAMTGHAGVGKSYISTIMGCPQKSCPGGDSCTMETAMCKVNDMFIMDGVGTNHYRDMLVNYGGKEIKISGLSYPLFNFLETVEREKISTIEFFEVYTAANTRSGSASNYFYDFIKDVLECPTVRVLNMFEEGYELHEKNRVPSDLIVHRFQEKLSDLKGQPCKISLTPTWRDSLISGDFVGINSVVDIKVCENLKTEREKLKNRNNGVARNPDTRNCEETYQAGSFCEFYSHGFCIVRVPIHRKRQNPDCIRQRDEANAIINQQNRALHEENVKATERLAEVERELESCRDRLSNFQ